MKFEEFLNKFEINEKTYILAIRSQLNRPQIFLNRGLDDIRTNAFNKNISHMWFANTDIQFILDPYAAATYCTSYMTKVDKSMTTELKSILQNCITNKTDANIRILKLGNAFLNAQQMSAQLSYLFHCIIVPVCKYLTFARTSICTKTSTTTSKIGQRIHGCNVQIYN